MVRCYSCGSYLEDDSDCVAEKVNEGERHTGLCWRGYGVEEAKRERLVADLVRQSDKRAVQLRLKEDDD